MKRIVLLIIKGYQNFVGPVLPKVCRYRPSCSQYALEAVSQYGVWRGVLMALFRILCCNPFFPGGYDPVYPVRKTEQNISQRNNSVFTESFTGHFSNGMKGSPK